MLFWILLGVIGVAVVWAFLTGLLESYGGIGDAFMLSFATAFLSALAGGLVLLVVGFTFNVDAVGTQTGSDRYQLRAVGTGAGMHGEFYLGTGYVNSTEVLNYITQSPAGDVRVDSAKASDSVVREDGGKAVDVQHWRMDGPWWFVPWDFGHRDTYTFHVPAGSVQGGYEVSTK